MIYGNLQHKLSKILSEEQEAQLRQPIDEYVGKSGAIDDFVLTV
jgi:hypothetical protein